MYLQNCKMILSHNRVEAGVKFEMQAEFAGANDNRWVGMGLSTDIMMGEDSVVGKLDYISVDNFNMHSMLQTLNLYIFAGCYGNTIANYWNTGVNEGFFYALPMEGVSY